MTDTDDLLRRLRQHDGYLGNLVDEAAEALTATQSQLRESEAEVEDARRQLDSVTGHLESADNALQAISVDLGGRDEWPDQEGMIWDVKQSVAAIIAERDALKAACAESQGDVAVWKKRAEDAWAVAQAAGKAFHEAQAACAVKDKALTNLVDQIVAEEEHGDGADEEDCPICNAIREAKSALSLPPLSSECGKGDGWQPIETAPQDGAEIDFWALNVTNGKGVRIAACYWDEEKNDWLTCWDNSPAVDQPKWRLINWRFPPLSPAPEASKQREEGK